MFIGIVVASPAETGTVVRVVAPPCLSIERLVAVERRRHQGQVER
jgi:hypothetical protein